MFTHLGNETKLNAVHPIKAYASTLTHSGKDIIDKLTQPSNAPCLTYSHIEALIEHKDVHPAKARL